MIAALMYEQRNQQSFFCLIFTDPQETPQELFVVASLIKLVILEMKRQIWFKVQIPVQHIQTCWISS